MIKKEVRTRVLDLLPTDREHAQHQRTLAHMACLSPEKFKATIQDLRCLDNQPIVSTSAGYWLATTKEEYMEFYFRERKQAETRLRTIELGALGFK